MNQRHLLTTAALFMTVLGAPSIGRTQTTQETEPVSGEIPSPDAVKVGEYQSPTGKSTSDTAIAEIHSHTVGGRQAATLFVRNIPVLTFVGQEPVATGEETKVGVIGNAEGLQTLASIANNSTKMATVGNVADVNRQINSDNNDPVKRASVVAAQINQLAQDSIDASKITVSWKGGGEPAQVNQAQNKAFSPQQTASDRYAIKVNGKDLVEINASTRLADTTNNLAQDALQATNRLRRLIGNASPLSEIANLPTRASAAIAKLPQQFSIAPIIATIKGIASFYGYDGSGNRTATGERFNPEGMTAAHRSLPFGTRVRVTNTRNGRSVVVRINDRGPFIRGRVIDLSTGAARVLGMMGSGVAPVRIEVLGR
ncbi:MAG: septal ring lytic transglycosylase RlpA family protein [Heteroscytonema crispum UTEX LB 1556]